MENRIRQHPAINRAVLRERASKASFQGVLIAAVAVVAATLAVSYFSNNGISLDGMVEAQKTNFALWVLDLMPFVFAYMGQYATYVVAREANSLVREQTRELRNRADDLERQATFAATHDRVTELPNRALFGDRVERLIGSGRLLASPSVASLSRISKTFRTRSVLRRLISLPSRSQPG